jgi:very-short-patch-repair endonuclease
VVREVARGIRNLDALLRERLPLAEGFEKGIELKVLRAARRANVPQPETQFKVLTKYGPYFIDAAWPDRKVGAEADGYSVHSTSRHRHNADRRRRNELETLGWRILNFTYDMSVAEVAAVLKANLKVTGGLALKYEC